MMDHELIEQYRQGSADAFSAIVRRHVDWVYSAAKRKVGDAHLAEDVTQAVFITLARKLPHARHGSLSPWLFAVLIRISRDAIKRRAIRQRHETEAAQMRPTTTPDPQADWNSIAPNLEDAVARLRYADQQAILLRFYEQLSFAEVGAMLGITEEAARKRVSRATEKLRGMLTRDGLSVPAMSLAGVLITEVVRPASAEVIAAGCCVTSKAVSTISVPLNQGLIAMLAISKTKVAIAATAVLLLLAGTWVVLTRQASALQVTRPASNMPVALFAGEIVDNPHYASWASHTVGSSLTLRSSSDGANATDSVTTYTLLEVTSEKVVVRSSLSPATAPDRTMSGPIEEIPSKVEKGQESVPAIQHGKAVASGAGVTFKDAGKETIEIAGKKYECVVMEFEIALPSMKATGKVWNSSKIPGRVAKIEMKFDGPPARRNSAIVTSIVDK